MLNLIKERIPALKENWDKYKHLVKQIKIPAKTVLLREGEVSRKMYMVNEGCLRAWHNNDGKDVTTQFFFENEGVSSMESFFTGEPSILTIESIEPSTIDIITKGGFQKLFKEIPDLQVFMNELLLKRLMHYAKLFFSRIKDNPAQRYDDLIKNYPKILQRVPQHYIASYLGITPVSLSRIRNRAAKIS
jgi:CRP-like cAMP-binding protein